MRELYLPPEDRADRARIRRREQQRRQARRRGGAPNDPWLAARIATARARREAIALLRQARGGAFASSSEQTKLRLSNRFLQLLRSARASPQRISALKGLFDEALRTPRGAIAQPSYRGGDPLLPGQTRHGTARPDYSRLVRRLDGSQLRVHVNLKSDLIHQLSPADALARARGYTADARRNAIQLPVGEPIVIRYAQRPSEEVMQAMKDIHFAPGSPVIAVHFGTRVFRNPNLPL